MGVLLSVCPPCFLGGWFGYSLHLQSAPSYAILMNRIRSCLLTRFVHSDRLSAPARDLFCLYCIIPGKKLPPQKSRFGGAIPKIFGVLRLPLKKSPQKAQNWGDLGAFSPSKRAAAALPVPVFPLWLQCAERSHENGTKDILKLAALVPGLALAGCGGSKTLLSPKDPTMLSIWHVYGEQADSPMNRLLTEFNDTVAGRRASCST